MTKVITLTETVTFNESGIRLNGNGQMKCKNHFEKMKAIMAKRNAIVTFPESTKNLKFRHMLVNYDLELGYHMMASQ